MLMSKHLAHYLRKGLSYLIPCQLCDSVPTLHSRLCQDCWHQLPWLKNTVQRHELDILAACHYAYPLDRMLQQFKYEQKLHFRYPLAAILGELRLPRVQAIVPMPISSARLIERGYNQSLVLAKRLAQQHHIPIWQPMMRAEQHSQKGLTRLERLENIEQQFQPVADLKQRFKRVLILDDVVTTGSSLKALQQAMREYLGCEKIIPVCLSAAQPNLKSFDLPTKVTPPDESAVQSGSAHPPHQTKSFLQFQPQFQARPKV